MIVEEEINIENNYTSEINKEQILHNLQEITITYIPYEQYNNLWIMGDFTEWEPKPMLKNKDIFTFKVVLIKGFKYYFTFTAKDQIVIDFNQEYETNPRSSAVNNFIDIKSDNIMSDSNSSILFDYKNNFILIKEARRNYTRAKMGNNKEVALFEKIMEFSEKYKLRMMYLNNKREETVSKLMKFYE